jgi:hypothetical protein
VSGFFTKNKKNDFGSGFGSGFGTNLGQTWDKLGTNLELIYTDNQ